MATKTKKKAKKVKAKASRSRIKAAPDHPIIGDSDARVLQREFNRIQKKYGILHPDIVLEESRKPSSVLHDYFEWDDQKAAEKFRLKQATKLIIAVHEIITLGGEEVEIQAWHAVSIATPAFTGKIRVATNEAFSNPDFSEQLLAKAMKEARRWKARYSGIVKLRGVFQAMGAVDAYLNKKMRAEVKAKAAKAKKR